MFSGNFQASGIFLSGCGAGGALLGLGLLRSWRTDDKEEGEEGPRHHGESREALLPAASEAVSVGRTCSGEGEEHLSLDTVFLVPPQQGGRR